MRIDRSVSSKVQGSKLDGGILDLKKIRETTVFASLSLLKLW